MTTNITGIGAGIGQALRDANGTTTNGHHDMDGKAVAETQDARPSESGLKNRAAESKSPYVRGHASNPVAWQLWGDETISLAKKQNRLLFVSIGYSACHWCHVMEKESFENDEVADLLNHHFIPVKIDREERPDIDRIYMNFVQATTGSGGWPLNVFLTPSLEPVFGGTYWPGPTTHTPSFEDQVDFLGILNKLSTVWREQEERCRLDASQIMQELRKFAAEGTFGARLGDGTGAEGLDLESLDEASSYIISTFDSSHGGFGAAPKFPTPAKLAFLLRLGQFPREVIDVVGADACLQAQEMAITTLRKMARGGIRDHVGTGFARYSVTVDWSLPHFEKMLYDNAQLLHVYLDAFLLARDAELLGVVYDLANYLTTTLAHPAGGFYSSEDADSCYRPNDTEKREGAYYVWTKREFESVLGETMEPILSAFFNVSTHGNVQPENDAHDEFIDQNVLAVVATPASLATQFGMREADVVTTIKEGKRLLREHREKERVKPGLDDKIVTSWNGIAIGALARAGSVIRTFDHDRGQGYINAASRTADFLRKEMYDASNRILYRVYREGRGDTKGFADDYAYLIDGLIDLYESTLEEQWLRWADELQESQITKFHDSIHGGFFSTSAISDSPDLILRLKDGMDAAEPSTNGTSLSNLLRLASAFNMTVEAESSTSRTEQRAEALRYNYASIANNTLAAFESEILQYPWLFGSFMPGIVASRLGTRSVVVAVEDIRSVLSAPDTSEKPAPGTPTAAVRNHHLRARGTLGSLVVIANGNVENAQSASADATTTPWLRQRNDLLKDLRVDEGSAGKILICENGACRPFDGSSDGTQQGLTSLLQGVKALSVDHHASDRN